MRLTTGLLGVAAAGLIAVGAAAQPEMMGPMGHGPMEGMEILHGLNLTSAQQGQVHAIFKQAWSEGRKLHDQLHALHEQMASQLLSAGSVTAEQLAPLVSQAEQVRAQMDQIHVDTMVKIRALLTPEQVSRAADLHQKLSALHDQERQLVDGGEE